MAGPQLSSVIVLPATDKLTAREILRAFKVSRQSIHLWRLRHNFPVPTARHGKTTLTQCADVAAWAAQRGSQIHWT